MSCKFEERRCSESECLDSDGFCISHCEVGIACHREMRLLADIGRLTPEAIFKIWDSQQQHWHEEHGAPAPKKSHTGNGCYQGQFAFTLTKSPSDDMTEEDMIKAVRKVMSQKSCPVKKYAWYLEYGDDEKKEHPHIHGMYETESLGRIETKQWKRAWPIWDPKHKLGKGFRGGYHRPVRDAESYSDYIKKDKGLNESCLIE